MTVDEVEHLVEEDQHRGVRSREDPTQGLGAGGRLLRGLPELRHSLFTGHLPGEVDPGCLAPLLGIPGVSDEDAHLGLGCFREPGLPQQTSHPLQLAHPPPGRGDVVERGEGVRLAAAELGDERHHRRRIGRFSRQPPQHHARVFAQGPGEARAGEELHRVAVILRRLSAHHLLQVDGELVGVEGASFADLLARGGDLVPGLHRLASSCKDISR